MVIRTDASHDIGHGHVMRCLTLASSLKQRGAEVVFVCREHDGNLCGLIAAQGFEVIPLPISSPGDATANIVASLGASPADDARSTAVAIASSDKRVDWLIVDHYAIGVEWESMARRACQRLMVLDDLADRPHLCDVLLDQNYVHSMATRYVGLVPEACSLFLGPTYALLKPEYAERHSSATPRAGEVKRILISFGGGDRTNFTLLALEAVLSLKQSGIAIDVALSDGSLHEKSIERAAKGRQNVSVYKGLHSLAGLIATADMAIGAGGATNWERICLGLPSLVVTTAANQRAIAAALHADGYVHWVGDPSAVDAAHMAAAVSEQLNHGADHAASLRCLALVDGAGAARIASSLTLNCASPLRAREAAASDEALLLEWANDPATRENSFSVQPIPVASHQAWFRERLRDRRNCRFFVVETAEGLPVGQVRFDSGDNCWTVSYAVSKTFRGRGLGRRVLEVALAEFRREETSATIVGIVKPDNTASNKIFNALGFRCAESERGFIWYSA